jgi:hypothetical protein
MSGEYAIEMQNPSGIVYDFPDLHIDLGTMNNSLWYRARISVSYSATGSNLSLPFGI